MRKRKRLASQQPRQSSPILIKEDDTNSSTSYSRVKKSTIRPSPVMNPPANPDPPIGSSNTNPIDLSSSDDEVEPNAPNTVEQNQLGPTTSSPIFVEQSTDGRSSEGPALANDDPTSTAMSEIDEIQDGVARSVGREALLLAYSKRERALAQIAKMERNIPKFRQEQNHYSELQAGLRSRYPGAVSKRPDYKQYARIVAGAKSKEEMAQGKLVHNQEILRISEEIIRTWEVGNNADAQEPALGEGAVSTQDAFT